MIDPTKEKIQTFTLLTVESAPSVVPSQVEELLRWLASTGGSLVWIVNVADAAMLMNRTRALGLAVHARPASVSCGRRLMNDVEVYRDVCTAMAAVR